MAPLLLRIRTRRFRPQPKVLVGAGGTFPSFLRDAAMSTNRHAASFAIAIGWGLISPSIRAADVTVQPSAGSGFVVKDASGANERLRVQESGAVSLPSVASAPAQSQALCMNASGQLGPCSGGSGGSYTAATGLTLTGTTFSVAPTYRLPQSCAANQVAQWNGTAWACGTMSSAALPAGSVNQTLRYDAGNALVANDLLQAFSDGGFIAGGTEGTGTVPTTGAGTRMMWYPGKAAFRAGSVALTEWDETSIGRGSVAMGLYTSARGSGSTAMGSGTVASGDNSTALGLGSFADYGSTAIGWGASADGYYSTAIGNGAHASGYRSTAMGFITTASGEQSVAVGSNVSTNGKKGSFIFGDASNRTLGITANSNEFRVIASGGVTFYTSADYMAGSYLTPGGGSWTSISDRNAKTAVQSVDSREVLKKVVALPLNTWQYKTQDAKYRHMGPMAQDFYSAFHLGESDKGIDTVDADGVALAAIQGLNALFAEKDAQTAARLDEKDREIAALREAAAQQAKDNAAQIAALRAEKDRQIATLRVELTTRVAALESLAGDLSEIKAKLRVLPQPAPVVVTAALKP